ncbi:MAG: ABC transporter permease [Candidatus Sulfopaludibacter sp.]|nr:ABC transporter permease [Candidatus Sulfopaludibacter sp.]
MPVPLRLLLRAPGTSAIAILSIALSVGAAAVVFTAIRAVLLEPLPYARPSQLVQLRTDYAYTDASHADWVSWHDMQDLARDTRTLSSVAIFHYSLSDLSGDSAALPEALYGLSVSANMFPTLGVTPMLGRNIHPEEDRPGSSVMILSYGLWLRRFQADRAAVGRQVRINGHPCTIIGVMPPDFDFPMRMATSVRTPSGHMDFSASLPVDPARQDRRNLGFGAVARLRPGVSLAQAREDLAAVSNALERAWPASNTKRRLAMNPLRDRALGTAPTGLMLLMAAASIFLLIGCANVANLLLARAMGRQREMAVRLALGASRGQIARHSLAESAALGALGGLAGYGLARFAWSVLPALAPHSIPRLAAARADGTVFAFALLVAILNSLAFGIAPALHASRRLPADALREAGTGGSIGGASSRVRSALVVAEVALAVVLVVIGGMLTGSFVRLLRTDPGFTAGHLLASIIVPVSDRYKKPEERRALFRGILDSVAALPGVEAAGAVDALPFTGENNGAAVFGDGSKLPRTSEQPVAEVDTVTAGYLPAMGVRLLQGRAFREEDVTGASDTALVSQAAADLLWPGVSPLGRRVCVNCSPETPPHWKEVVGVVSGIRHSGLEERGVVQVYLAAGALESAQFLVVRANRPAGELTRAIRTAVAAVDPNQPVFLSARMSTLIADSVADRRFIMTLLAITAGLALVLAAAGVYGVISYVTSRRTREIGLRMALGATPGQVGRLVFRQGMQLAAVGAGIGLTAAVVLARVLRSVLTGLESSDPALMALAGTVAIAAAAVACWAPARRATRIDPMSALR